MRQLFVCALLLFTLPVLATPLPSEPHIYVEGSATLDVEPSYMVLAVAVEATDLDLEKAKGDVDGRARQLIELADVLGIERSDVNSRRLQISPAYRYTRDGEQEFLGTRVNREIEFTLRDLSKYSDLIGGVTSASISEIVRTSFHPEEGDALMDQAQAAALEDAKQRALRLAEGADRSLGRVHSISEFDLRQDESWQLRPSRQIGASDNVRLADAMALRAPGEEPFVPGTIKVTARVYVVYLLR